MSEQQILLAALAQVNAANQGDPVGVGHVAKYRLTADSIILIIDRGIAGSPKHVIPLASLPEPKPDAKPKRQAKARASRKRKAKATK